MTTANHFDAIITATPAKFGVTWTCTMVDGTSFKVPGLASRKAATEVAKAVAEQIDPSLLRVQSVINGRARSWRFEERLNGQIVAIGY